MTKKKKAALLFLLLFWASFSAASANVISECVYDALVDRAKHGLGLDFEASSYLTQLLKDTAVGKPENTVKKILDDYGSQAYLDSLDANSVAKDIGLKILEKLVPAAGGPISLLMSASEAAHSYTRGMLDFYKERHMRNFYDMVVKPSRTVAQLKANYKNFIENYVNTGASDTNVLYNERKDLENKFHEAFLKAVVPIKRMEEAEKAKKRVLRITARKLRRMRTEAARPVMKAHNSLLAAKIKPTAKNINLYLHNPEFYKKVMEKRAQILEEARKKKKAAKKNKQKIYLAVKPPKASLDSFGEFTDMETNLILTDQRVSDYSSFINAYGDWSDKFMAGEIESEAYSDATNNINRAVRELYGKCLKESERSKNSEALLKQCRSGYRRFENEKKRIDESVKRKKEEI
mgnify:CR=1 FL=1